MTQAAVETITPTAHIRKRAVLYVRRSLEEKADKSSLHYQEEMCRQRAADGNCTVVEVVREEISAYDKTIEQRDGLQRVFELALSGEVDVIICWQKSRLVRDMEDEIIIRQLLLEKANCEIWFSDETELPFTKGTEDESVNKLMQMIKTWSQETEVAALRARLKSHLRIRAKQGEYVGGTFTGYKWNKDTRKMEQIPGVIDAVKNCFKWYLYEGCTVRTIADLLNEQGYRTHKGKKFYPATVSTILKNKIYCGYYRWGFTTSKRRDKPVPAEGHEHQVDWLEPIITLEEWTKVQQIMLDRTRKPRGSKRDYSRVSKSVFMLSGKIFCGCGKLMAAHNGSRAYKNQDGTEHYHEHLRYVCRGEEHVKAYKRQVDSKMVDSTVRQAVIEYIKDADFNLILAKANQLLKEYTSDKAAEKKRAVKCLKQLRTEIETLQVNVRNTTHRELVNRYEEDMLRIDKEISEIERRCRQIDRDIEKVTVSEEGIRQYLDFLQSFEQSEELQSEKVQILFDKIIDSVIYSGAELQVNLKWRIPLNDVQPADNDAGVDETVKIAI